MTAKILLTSFDIWLPHHRSNASDDLLAKVSEMKQLPYPLSFLRKLPVDFEEAPERVRCQIRELQPNIIINCGMAESRQKLTVESTAICEHDCLKTCVDLDWLLQDLAITEISHEAGKFVCEKLYYASLKYLKDTQSQAVCIFVHVPILTPHNTEAILTDFLAIVDRLYQTHTLHPGNS